MPSSARTAEPSRRSSACRSAAPSAARLPGGGAGRPPAGVPVLRHRAGRRRGDACSARSCFRPSTRRRRRPTCAASWPPARPSAKLERDAASLASRSSSCFPFWAFTDRRRGRRPVVLEPAAPSALRGLQGLALPPGDSVAATPESIGATPCLEPDVPVDTARQWLASRAASRRHAHRALPPAALPLHLRLPRASYAAAVDAVAGQVFPADFPAKAETPYVLVAAVAVALFTSRAAHRQPASQAPRLLVSGRTAPRPRLADQPEGVR